MTASLTAMGQATPAPAATPTPADQTPAATTPAAAPTPVWSVGPMDLSGFVDVYYSYNHNRPYDQISDGYNFDENDDQFSLEAAKITINHDPDPIGAHVDVIFGRTNQDIHTCTNTTCDGGIDNYIEQAYLSIKPTKAKGFEADLGQFVTSAGDEVIETMSNWSYSHGILFTDAIPYYHFGLRTSMPFTKTWTAGFQLVNGWNNVQDNNGGVTIGLTSAVVKPHYSWFVNYYVGPENSGFPPNYAGTQKGYRNLIDTTWMWTPTAKFNAYINYDYGQNHTPAYSYVSEGTVKVPAMSQHWQGVAFSAREQVTANAALVGRIEYFADQGHQTGVNQALKEFTATYEYKWPAGLLMRTELRHDWSNQDVFTYGNDPGQVKAQTTLTAGFIAFFGPKRQ
jgi:Putative beta-barrel porin-2, OmpL-like. bbp2